MALVEQAQRAKGRAVRWIRDRLDCFNPLGYQHTLKFKFALKASVELALQCALVHHRAGEEPLTEMTAFLWTEVFGHPALQEYLLESDCDLLAFGFYGSLRLCGFEDLVYRARLERLLEQGYPVMAERMPSRELDLIYSLTRADLPLRGLSPQASYARSLLAKHPPLYNLTDQDAYAITHTLFFLTDFGQAPNPTFSSDDHAYFAWALPRLLQYYLHKRDWDLSGELLIAMNGVGLDHLPLFREAWSVLIAAQGEDGSFAGPAVDESAVDAQEGTDAAAGVEDPQKERWRLFHDNYHTTLVALLGLHLSLGGITLPASTRGGQFGISARD